jgi:hypothetical protein
VDELAGGVISWEDPPPGMVGGSSPNRPWAIVAAQLRTRPGVWALIDRDSNIVLQSRIKRGVSWWGPPGSFEVTTRNIDGRILIWARYIGT